MSFSTLPVAFVGWSVFGVGVTALGLASLALGRTRWGRSALLALGPVLLLAGCGQAVAGFPAWGWRPTLGLGALSGALALVRSPWSERTLVRALGLARRPLVQGLLLLACGVGGLGWQLRCLEHSVEPFDDAPLALDSEVHLRPLEVTAWTDDGALVHLFAAVPPRADHPASTLEGSALRDQGLERQVIQMGQADVGYNCHGWVFTGGRHWVRGSSVEQILKDNAYQVVQRPAPGDVAVFRNAKGAVQHTALVKVVAPDGMVLLESKWGQLSRYLHTPAAHLYRRCTCAYYHTPRGTHLLWGLEDSPLAGARIERGSRAVLSP